MAHASLTETPPVAVAHDDGLGWALAMLLRRWQEGVDETLDDLPNGPRGFQILSAAVRGCPPTQAALAARLGIDRTVITYLIDALADAGVVERQQDPVDRRARRIVATEHGRTVFAELDVRVSAVEDEVLAGLSPGEKDSLRSLLQRAASAVQAVAPGTNPCEAVSRVLAADAAPKP